MTDTSKVIIKTDPAGQGRYLVSGTSITAGDTILSEYPLVAGPLYTRSRCVCLQCLRLVTDLGTAYRCSSCGFPVCDAECEMGNWHQLECKLLSATQLHSQIDSTSTGAGGGDGWSPIYSCITVLRTLLLRDRRPADWRIVDSLMDHDQARQDTDSPKWHLHEQLVVSFVQGSLGLGDQFSRAAIRRVIGVLRTNSVKLESRAGHGDGIAVYPTYSFANHNCLCNTYTRKHKDLRLELIAHTPIAEGDTVWTRYTTPQLGNLQRIADIQKTWHFQCTCARCQDPTEFGTMMSGLMCGGEGCHGSGVLLPIHSNIIGSPWSCDVCSRKLGITSVQKIIKSVTDDIAANREKENTILLNLIDKYADRVLHRNHYLLIGVKEVVLQRLMRSTAKLTGDCDLTAEERKKRIELLELRTRLFEEIVAVVSVVDSPGAPWQHKLQRMREEESRLKAQINSCL